MKKFLSLIVAFAMVFTLFALVSCNSDKDDSDNTTESTESPSDEPLTATLTIAGNDLSSYKIVYARSEYYKQGPKVFTTEYDFYKLTAINIRNEIYNITGVTLDIELDTSTNEGSFEILVGPTNRAESGIYDEMDVYTYQNTVKNGKLVLGGGYDASYLAGNEKTSYCWASTYHSFDYIVDHIQSEVDAGNSEIDFAEGFDQKGSMDLITVACIGDSITEGDKASDWNVTSYPPVLQRYLWQDYVIINYGKCGKTMRNDMDRRYNTTLQYRTASKYASRFDIALIMLGTNDFLNDSSFSAADDKSFNDSAMGIVEMLTKKNSSIKLAIMNCPAYYGSNTVTYAHVRGLQDELFNTLKNDGYDASFFDMYTFTDQTLTSSRYPDALHPNDEGYALMAEKLSSVVPAIAQGIWDSENQEIISE